VPSKIQNKKELKLELNKLNIKSDEREKNNNNLHLDYDSNNKIRPQSVKFQNALKLKPISSRQNNNFGIVKNNTSSSKEKSNKITLKKNKKENNFVAPIIGDMKNNNNNKENIFGQPNNGGYKMFYNHFYQNYLNLKSNDNIDKDNKDKNIPLFLKKFGNNIIKKINKILIFIFIKFFYMNKIKFKFL
jgi:hypothetical protein